MRHPSLAKLFTSLASLTLYQDLLYSFLAILLALLIGAILIFFSGHSPLAAYHALFLGAFGDLYQIANTLLAATTLIFTGLAVASAFQAGLFNIGVEGQLYLGGLASALVGLYLDLPSSLLIPLALLAGALMGGLWALLPGILKVKTGAHEVITTIMMNYIGVLLTTYLVKTFFKDTGPVDQTPRLVETARLPELIAGTRFSIGFILAILLALLFHYFLYSTRTGFEMRLVGLNPQAAAYGGVSVSRTPIQAMVLSGAFGGLAGSVVVMGVLYRFITNFSPGYGFTGIAVALLGRNTPLGVLPAAFLFGALQSGGMSMQLFTRVPMDLMTVIQGLVVLFVAAPVLIRTLLTISKRRGGRVGTFRDHL